MAPAVAGLALTACLPKRYPLNPPDTARMATAAPDSFTVRFTTTRGPFDVRVHRDWAPRGADRIYYLVKARFFDGVKFFRVVNGSDGKPFVAQFGMSGDTAVTRAWHGTRIPDDSVRRSNVRGTLAFAAGGPNTRTTQVYVNFSDNSRLDRQGFAVFGEVVAGMATVVDELYRGYPDVPSQDSIARQGNAYLTRKYPRLDGVEKARVVQEWRRE
jgi:peptidyl-prolyl cis-trans isomerase A (cyclophilin A)